MPEDDIDTPAVSQMPLVIKGGKLPINFEPTPSEYYEALVPRIRATISDENVLLGSTESTEPTSNVGPWFTDNFWKFWDVSVNGYVASMQIYSNGYTLRADAAPTENRTQYLQDKSGTIALLLDTYVPRATVEMDVSTSVNIDWSESSSFVADLSQDVTFTFTNQNDAGEIVVTVTNNGTAYTVAWPADVGWPGGVAPTQPIATAGGKAVGVYVIRFRHTVPTSFNSFGEFVATYNTDSSPIDDLGGPSSVTPVYGGAGGGGVNVN